MSRLLRVVLAVVALLVAATVGAGISVAADGDAFSAMKTVTRTLNGAVSSREVTVTVDHTQNLRGRERVRVNWSGAIGTSAQATNPYGSTGVNQENPVVILQCRGTADTVKPETCFTSAASERTAATFDPDSAIWRRDPAWDNATAPTDPCGTADNYTVPFVTASGKKFDYCTDQHVAPESLLPAELFGFTGRDGTGAASFEIRTDVENESLGCNHSTSCSLVVIPITGTSCDTAHPGDLQYNNCSAERTYGPGEAYGETDGTPALKGNYWWTASQWKNRITVPLTFALPANTCDLLDSRPPVGFYGSELLEQASLQWSPAYCLDKDRFKYQHNQMSDGAGFDLMLKGQAAAALVSSEHDPSGAQVAYGPAAVTGFGIGYVIDKPRFDANNQPLKGGEYHDLKLDARLIAKLLTQSYPGDRNGTGHPGMGSNPLAIQADPEFQALNPDAPKGARIEGATLLSLSEASDTVQQLTDYIAHDPAAMAFIKGEPDPWGMVVNPNYKGYDLPRNIWELKDDFVAGGDCFKANPSPYFTLMAAPVSRIYTITQNLLDSQPNIQTKCVADNTSVTGWKLGKIDRQGYGNRFMLGLLSLGDAARFGIDVATLETSPDRFVGPTEAAQAAAVALMKQPKGKPLAPYSLDQAAVRKAGDAYPGTMVVYAAAKTCELDKALAGTVASFLKIASTEGQVEGSGNGRLPRGYLPITKSGATSALFATAQKASDAIKVQKCAAAVPAAAPVAVAGAPAAAGPIAAAPAAPVAGTATAPLEPTSMGTTAAPSSRVAFILLPLLVALAIAGAIGSGVARVMVARRA